MSSPSKLRQEEFDKQLHKLIDKLTNGERKKKDVIRPFLCESLPLECPIFLVGINPSKTAPFWPRWSRTKGCNKQGWLVDYLEINGSLSPTRHRIEILVKTISPTQCLETNIYTAVSPDEGSLTREQCSTEVFDFLLKTVRPRIVFAHGKSVVNHLNDLNELTGSEIPFHKLNEADCPLDLFTKVKFDGFTFDVVAGPHLSRGWSYHRVEALGEVLADRHRRAKRRTA